MESIPRTRSVLGGSSQLPLPNPLPLRFKGGQNIGLEPGPEGPG